MGQMVESRRFRWSFSTFARPKLRLFSGLILSLLLLGMLAACSGPGDDDDDSGDQTPSATASTSSGVDATITPGDNSEPTSTAEAATATTDTVPATATVTVPPATATTAQTTATPAEQETLVLSVYYLRDEKIATAHRELPSTQQVGAAAVTALLEGPTDSEAEAGLTTTIPDGTEFLGLTISDSVATVDLSSEFEAGGGSLSMQARLAQVVYTLTQFPTVESVSFMLDGEPIETFGGEGIMVDEPLGRADFEDLTPAIFVEGPAVDDGVTSPLRVFGTANTFEAVFQLQVLDADGTLLYDEPVTATSGTGTRGTFDVTVEFDATTDTGTVRVLEYSAKDGSETNVVEIPVTFE